MELMKGKSNFSIWVAGILITVLLLTVGAYLLTKNRIENYIYMPVDRAEQIVLTKGKYIYPTKDYDTVELANLEKEYFAVENPGETLKIVDKEGNILFDTKVDGAWLPVEYGIAVTAGGKQNVVLVDTSREKMIVTSYDEVVLHPSGNYYLGINYVWADDPEGTYSRYTVEDFDGNVLLQSEVPLELTADEGYVVCWTQPVSESYEEDGGTYYLYNFQTKEIVYRCNPGERLIDRAFGYTILSASYPVGDGFYNGGYRFLDKTFQGAMNEQVFWDVQVYDDFIGVTALDGVYYNQVNQIPNDIRDLFQPRVYNEEGTLIYEGAMGQELVDLYGDIIVTTKQLKGPNKHFYARLTEGGDDDE